MPGVLAGSLLVFIPAVGDFINADYLGGTRTTMIGNVIQKQFLVVGLPGGRRPEFRADGADPGGSAALTRGHWAPRTPGLMAPSRTQQAVSDDRHRHHHPDPTRPELLRHVQTR